MFRFLRSRMYPTPVQNKRSQSHEVKLGVHELEERRVMSSNPLVPTQVPGSFFSIFTPQPGLDVNVTLIKGMYESILGRPADPSGLAYWNNQLDGGANPENIAYTLVNSTEARIKEVDNFYQDILGRAPSAAELNEWVPLLQNGYSEQAMLELFLNSPEFSAPKNNVQFVTALYQILLNRTPDQAGLGSWVSQLNNGTLSRAQLVVDLVNSPESIDLIVYADFGAYLEQVPTSGQVTQYASQIQAGTLSYGQFIASLLGSAQYYNDAIVFE